MRTRVYVIACKETAIMITQTINCGLRVRVDISSDGLPFYNFSEDAVPLWAHVAGSVLMFIVGHQVHLACFHRCCTHSVIDMVLTLVLL